MLLKDGCVVKTKYLQHSAHDMKMVEKLEIKIQSAAATYFLRLFFVLYTYLAIIHRLWTVQKEKESTQKNSTELFNVWGNFISSSRFLR